MNDSSQTHFFAREGDLHYWAPATVIPPPTCCASSADHWRLQVPRANRLDNMSEQARAPSRLFRRETNDTGRTDIETGIVSSASREQPGPYRERNACRQPFDQSPPRLSPHWS